MYAAVNGYTDIVTLLLQRGADINIQDKVIYIRLYWDMYVLVYVYVYITSTIIICMLIHFICLLKKKKNLLFFFLNLWNEFMERLINDSTIIYVCSIVVVIE